MYSQVLTSLHVGGTPFSVGKVKQELDCRWLVTLQHLAPTSFQNRLLSWAWSTFSDCPFSSARKKCMAWTFNGLHSHFHCFFPTARRRGYKNGEQSLNKYKAQKEMIWGRLRAIKKEEDKWLWFRNFWSLTTTDLDRVGYLSTIGSS